ncbi:Collagen alpha-1(XV) chain [Amphibalanus amphitrite]|uniref:Collagen alpha-1(XV) chain n=1 Tax=Amphibalanus amphitrite TaxID=1232801 RepID=A0A6A4WF23_AMPAM|nr:Collagen alpha-1(XV) chain [Amphibalanus amphitrite]
MSCVISVCRRKVKIISLLDAIPVPFPEKSNLAFVEGEDGFPAYGFKKEHEVKRPYRLFLPERLPREFAVAVTVLLRSSDGGFLFAVLNPLETVVQLGVQLTPAADGNTNISLLYTDSEVHFTSQRLATFTVPSVQDEWTKLALQVTDSEVTLYLNCSKHSSAYAPRVPLELIFDPASTLFIGQAGGIIGGQFEVSPRRGVTEFELQFSAWSFAELGDMVVIIHHISIDYNC